MQRQTFASLLIALILLFLAGFAAFKIYYSRGRVYERRVRKEQTDHFEAMARRDARSGEQHQDSD